MDETRQILRLDLHEGWSTEELGRVLVNLSGLYDLRLFLELLREDIQEWKWEQCPPDFEEFPPSVRNRLRWLPYRLWLPFWPGLPPLDDSYLFRLSALLTPEERLRVWRVGYTSTGYFDLDGLSVVIDHLKDFISTLTECMDESRSRTLSKERAELENGSLRIKNASKLIALGWELGYSETEMRTLLRHVDDRQDPLVKLIIQRKLKGVSIRDE